LGCIAVSQLGTALAYILAEPLGETLDCILVGPLVEKRECTLHGELVGERLCTALFEPAGECQCRPHWFLDAVRSGTPREALVVVLDDILVSLADEELGCTLPGELDGTLLFPVV